MCCRLAVNETAAAAASLALRSPPLSLFLSSRRYLLLSCSLRLVCLHSLLLLSAGVLQSVEGGRRGCGGKSLTARPHLAAHFSTVRDATNTLTSQRTQLEAHVAVNAVISIPYYLFFSLFFYMQSLLNYAHFIEGSTFAKQKREKNGVESGIPNSHQT